MKLSALGFFLASALFAQQQTITLNAPPPPAVVNVSAQATQTGLGAYCWWVVATYPIGKAPVSSPICLGNVGGTVKVSWAAMPGATAYDVLRTSGPSLPSGSAAIAVATGVSGTSQTDNLTTPSSYTINSAPPATANIKLDNTNYATPGLYQNLNNGAYSPIGTGGGGGGTATPWAPVALGNISGTVSLDLSAGNQIFSGTLIGDVTLTNTGAGTASYQIDFVQDASGGHKLTFDNTFVSGGAMDPTATTGECLQVFNWIGAAGLARPAGDMVCTGTNGVVVKGTPNYIVQFPAVAGVMAGLSATNIYTSSAVNDASTAAHTTPSKTGLAANKPATCSVGEEYFATDAAAGRNKYYCTATNTWTQQTGGGGGSGVGTIWTGSTASATLASSSTKYSWINTQSPVSVEANVSTVVPVACTAKNLYVQTATTQDTSGSLTLVLNQNGVASALTVVIAANQAAGTYGDTTHTVALAAGDIISIKFINAATVNSAAVRGWSLQCN